MGTREAAFMYKLLPRLKNTRFSPILEQKLLLGQVLPHDNQYQKAAGFNPGSLVREEPKVEVRVPYYVYDEFLKTFFEHQWDFYAFDDERLARPGDTVLLERLEDSSDSSESISLRHEYTKEWWKENTETPKVKPVTHKLLELVYKCGDVCDPVSQKMVVAERYRDQMKRTAKLYGRSESDFDYDTAPPRGWQAGKKDFSDKKPFKKWHEFGDDDKYGLL